MSAASRAADSTRYRRETLLVLVPLLGLVGILWLAPIPQDPRYHHFADSRTLLGVPNFANVASNLVFLVVGVAGLALSLGARRTGAWIGWATFFAGVALVCVGSGYYHAAPTSAALVWDRLPMTMAFMGLFVALLSEHATVPLDRYLLLPALVAGIASIVWWHIADDLRFFLWVQSAPLLIIPLALLLFPAQYTRRFYLLYGLALYLLAKVAEIYDQELYALTQATLSGHSIKHLLAALSALSVYLMLRRRYALPPTLTVESTPAVLTVGEARFSVRSLLSKRTWRRNSRGKIDCKKSVEPGSCEADCRRGRGRSEEKRLERRDHGGRRRRSPYLPATHG